MLGRECHYLWGSHFTEPLMFRAVRCTTALLALLAAAACGDSPIEPSVRQKAPDAADTVVPARTSADCNPQTGEGCCWESQPWWC